MAKTYFRKLNPYKYNSQKYIRILFQIKRNFIESKRQLIPCL